ncbi:DUF3000 domain-containing protein [Curtobacterium sp. VKM Ac-2861]|uniref:DUF3000 domain-containing protein n=1 Tax=Bacteria TaxID=2 RepID=UPI000F50A071|nr:MULTISPECIES: DUF3000 domain-containing protein [unclassified Curtobacterium]NQW89057.1 DUF3000 domain-containing protein [Curtobacterium sp. VKM Ac-2861]MBF4587323.1 DUF3000 domain-containing protein [Curtobacterium sp. VKM Ac-2887]RPE82131.1 DUF3000 family protein [Curtobacterium sp. PhB137]TCU45354.1 DUF3000 family protein [Curtobacterium sp. PhB146]TCU84190.1 DUF3000 family protein [Curtobacterium sp. PhB191]
MSETREPDAFARLRAFVSSGSSRSETTVTEIPSPTRIAPFSIALAADVSGTAHGVESDLGTGRFIALYDPEEPEGWGGAFRVVSFAQAPLEPEIGVDEFVADVTWSWLVDALETHGAEYDHASGTATKIISRGYGDLAAQGDGAQLELRASWTPRGDDLTAHVQAWQDIVAMLAGLPPASDGVTLLAPRRLAK